MYTVDSNYSTQCDRPEKSHTLLLYLYILFYMDFSSGLIIYINNNNNNNNVY